MTVVNSLVHISFMRLIFPVALLPLPIPQILFVSKLGVFPLSFWSSYEVAGARTNFLHLLRVVVSCDVVMPCPTDLFSCSCSDTEKNIASLSECAECERNFAQIFSVLDFL